MKCFYCHKDIENPENELYQEAIKTKKGTTNNRNYHKKCFDIKVKEWNEWCSLYEYILEKYFLKTVPEYFLGELKKLREHYDYKIMLSCLKDIELNLLKNMAHKVFNGFTKSRYILVSLQNSIDSWYEKSLKQNNENLQLQNEYKSSWVTITKKYKPKTDKTDYDYLD